MGQEKRAYQRFNLNRPARCAFVDSFPETFPVTLVDIGPEGVGFVSDRAFAFGVSAYLIIELSEQETVKVIIKARFSRPLTNTDKFHVGAKIVDASSKDMERFIRAYYAQIVPLETGRKKVLVIAHDRGLGRQLQAALARLKYDCLCAYDGASGLAAFASEKPDAVILETTVTKLDAYGVVRQIRRILQDGSTPILVVVGKKAEAAKVMKDNIGVQGCFVKPLHMDEFLKEVERRVYT